MQRNYWSNARLNMNDYSPRALSKKPGIYHRGDRRVMAQSLRVFQSPLGFSNASVFSARSAVKLEDMVISLKNSTVPSPSIYLPCYVLEHQSSHFFHFGCLTENPHQLHQSGLRQHICTLYQPGME